MNIFDAVGNTPTFSLEDNINDIYLKYEGGNPFGSSKDRAPKYVLSKLLEQGIIDHHTVIIESSSGNMGIALAATCKAMGVRFICVIDPHISSVNELLIRSYGADVIKVAKADENNSYLKTRLETVQKILNEVPGSYWFNQYGNPLVCEAYEKIGNEIVRDISEVQYVFVAVSSGGTICGVSDAIKSYNANIKIIAVDVEGSKVFDSTSTKRRHLSGIGSSIKSSNLKRAVIDEYIIVSESEGIKCCHELLEDHIIFAGASSGCVYAAIKKYVEEHGLEKNTIVGLLNDRGDRYINTIYNNEWVKERYNINV